MMKVAPESKAKQEVWIKPVEFEIPKGLIGFSDATKYELLINEEEEPFMWIRSVDHHELGFVVIDPSSLYSDYEVVLNDDDVNSLGITEADDALILNIVTTKDDDIEAATINLIGPIVVNRKTLVGKQVIVSNYTKYSARHPLLSESSTGNRS